MTLGMQNGLMYYTYFNEIKKEIIFCVFVTFVRLIQIKCTHILPSSQFNIYSIVSSSAKGYINTCISKCRPLTQ